MQDNGAPSLVRPPTHTFSPNLAAIKGTGWERGGAGGDGTCLQGLVRIWRICIYHHTRSVSDDGKIVEFLDIAYLKTHR
jgi:hypothetical protein